MHRDEIIEHLAETLKQIETVDAVWVEGADARGTVDRHSDIDLVVAVADGAEEDTLTRIDGALSELGGIDYLSDEDAGDPSLRHRVYHLAGTPASLLIDVVIQPRRREHVFDPAHPDEIPKPIFEKRRVIRFDSIDPDHLARARVGKWVEACNRFLPEARVARFVKRGRYLEGMASYYKYVLGPLVELLRLKYAPRTTGYGLVHISEHLPSEVVARLEPYYGVRTVSELGQKLADARTWFGELNREFDPR